VGDSRTDAARLSERRRDWPLVVRRARASDEAAVLGFATGTWDGWDYIPNAWPVWLDATDGVMLVACRPADDRPVAVSRVALVSPTEAWLEGIRVDPAVRGMDVATDMQIAELRWAAAQGASVVRYATGSRNEASHRLGARHGFELLFRYRGYWWTDDPSDPGRDPSAFDSTVRATATEQRRAVLDGLAAAGRVAGPSDTAVLWHRLHADATFAAAHRLYEPRPWAMGELTAAAFARHVERGEVIVAGARADSSHTDWALGILLRDQLAGEDSSLRLAIISGAPQRVVELVEAARAIAGQTLKFRVPEDSPLRADGHDPLLAAGYRTSDWTLSMLGRPIDSTHPAPEVDASALTLADAPAAVIEPPWRNADEQAT
jgi:RimJ/RimL family protein N-acetyltransferase